ncbi:inositol polyphosphate kinase-domain-containing protein, partial [Coniochaeta sp. 2T2.1]
MMGTKEIPKREELVDYNYAVAGHEGTLCDADGELFIKPCTAKEIEFYERANAVHPEFAELMPIYFGQMVLNDMTDMNSINEQLPAVADHISTHMKEEVIRMAHQLPKPDTKDNVKWVPNKSKKIATNISLVLENAAYGYKRPNILDVKLGQRLWADDAPLEKKQRFDKISQDTTHGSLGFRIAGMRVYRGSDDPKELDQEDYRIYDKDFGRVDVTKDNVLDAFRKFLFNESAGVDEELGKAVARAFMEEVKHVQEVLEKEESRMYSASLLFVFEGDGDALRTAIDEASGSVTMSQKGTSAKGEAGGRSTARVDSGIAMDEATGELVMTAIDGVVEDDEEEDAGSDDENVPRIYCVKLIDFAHAQFTPGQGPDENNLEGVRSLVQIFEELSRED